MRITLMQSFGMCGSIDIKNEPELWFEDKPASPASGVIDRTICLVHPHLNGSNHFHVPSFDESDSEIQRDESDSEIQRDESDSEIQRIDCLNPLEQRQERVLFCVKQMSFALAELERKQEPREGITEEDRACMKVLRACMKVLRAGIAYDKKLIERINKVLTSSWCVIL